MEGKESQGASLAILFVATLAALAALVALDRGRPPRLHAVPVETAAGTPAPGVLTADAVMNGWGVP